jgi:Cu(I)/Ag(I) efflux system membrane protein CusA/SilA
VRYAPQFRRGPDDLASVLVTASNGAQIPLGQISTIRRVSGPAAINSENGLLEVSVLLNSRGRDPGSVIADADRAIRRTVALPPGYYYNWSGQFENQVRAKQRLQIVMPIVIGVIFILLFVTYRSFLEAAHVLLAVPFALTGGLYLLWLMHYNFSVAVWVGFIALFGTAVQTTVVMVIYLEEAVARKRRERSVLGFPLNSADLREAVMEGALLRLRPKLMTVSTVVAGLLPVFWSHGVGSEVIRPLATPVLGGMLSSLLHVLLVTPVIFLWLRERELKQT